MQCAAPLILTPAAIFRKAGVRGAASGPRDALNKPGGPPSAALPFLPPTGRLGRVRTRQVSKRRRLPPPSRVQRAQPPLGVQRVPLFSKTSEGGAGGEQSVTPRPNSCRGYDRAMTALDWAMTALWPRWIALRNGPIPFPWLGSIPTRQVGKRRRCPPPSRVQGAAPCLGVQGESPCSQKRWRVGRWDNSAGQNKTIRLGYAPPPLQDTNYCATVPP